MKILSCNLIFIFFVQIFNLTYSSEDRGFIFTAPKRFLAGSEENVCVVSKEKKKDSVDVRVGIYEDKSELEIASAAVRSRFDDASECFKIRMPRTKSTKGRLQLTINFKAEEDYKINYVKQISIQPDPDVTFIQTDKPIYKGGDVVRFRIFTIRSNLTPVTEPVGKIWIENPNGVHVARWLNETVENGFVSESFRLSTEPFCGKWAIRTSRDDEITSREFLVEDYVLPRFSVSIKAPSSVSSPYDVDVEACARYTFGEPVRGFVVLHFAVQCTFAFYCPNNSTSLKRRISLDSRGCASHRFRLANPSAFVERVDVNATVEEEGTEIKGTASAVVEIKPPVKDSPEFFIYVKRKQFKPGLPLKGKVLTKYLQTNVSVPANLCLQINEHKECKGMLLGNGIVNFVFLPVVVSSEEIIRANIVLNHVNGSTENNPAAILSLLPWYSPSQSYLQVENLNGNDLQCNKPGNFRVVYSIRNASSPMQFYYMVKSRGDILLDRILSINENDTKLWNSDGEIPGLDISGLNSIREFEFNVSVDEKMSPVCYLIVFYIKPDGEVIADTLVLNVQRCFKNQVNVSWEKEISEPGTRNRLSVKTSSDSVCALNVADESLNLISNSNDVNEDVIFKEIKKYQVQPSGFDSNPCQNRNAQSEEEITPLFEMPASSSNYVDSSQAFDDFGVLVITDLNLETRPCSLHGKNFLHSSTNNLTARHSNVDINGNRIEDEETSRINELDESSTDNLFKNHLEHKLRTYFPEIWIWDLIHVNSSEGTGFDVDVPDTVTKWNAAALCLSPYSGLGIAKAMPLTTYKPFFVDFALPDKIKRKEIFHLKAVVFSYMKVTLPVKVTYVPSDGLVSKTEEHRSFCIAPKSKIVYHFALEAVKLGETEVKVKAEVDYSFLNQCSNSVEESELVLSIKSGLSDAAVKKTTVDYEGFPAEEVKSRFVCGNSEQFEKTVSWDVKLPADVVENSASTDVLVSGDILGAAVKNVDRLIALPTGCGEQNMMLLASNLLLLEYLLLTKPEDSKTVEKALRNLDLGYQRQLKFKRSDGLYSAFGEEDEKGSLWLTAFVVRYLSQAEKYVHVDRNDLKETVKSITNYQLENGCFPIIGKVYHRDFKEKLHEEDSSKTLTAYVLISLIESGMSSKTSTVVKNAIYCLKGTDESLGLYGNLVTAYALLLAGETRDGQTMINELLKDAKRSYKMLWWENDENPFLESSIEMTSYGILSLVKLSGPYFLAAASDALRWITQHRNQNGGFFSTQDTILALEAMSKFSSMLPKIDDHDSLSVRVTTEGAEYAFNISEENRLLQQSYSLPFYFTNISFEANGKGCALVQTWLRFNTRRGSQNEKLKIQLKIDSVSNVDYHSVKKFHICVRYKGTKEKINMAILEVDMVSGFYPVRSSLYDIRISRKGVRRWEEYENKINFYFEDLRNKKVCLQFLIEREICVENPSPASIRLYDYYHINHNSMIRYNLQSRCNDSDSTEVPSEVKSEFKRELRREDFKSNSSELSNFADLDFDLETPQGGNGVMPVFALPPPPGAKDQNCPICLSRVPDIFSKMYCSAQVVVKVLIRGKDVLDFKLDLTPRKNVTALQRTVLFTMKNNCECEVLNSVNSYALLLVTPPRSIQVNVLQEMHLDSLTQLYSLDRSDELPQFLTNAMEYCKNWKNDS